MTGFEKNDKVVVDGREYVLLEEVNPLELAEGDELYKELFGDEPGCSLGIAKAMCHAASPNAQGWYPLYDVSFVKRNCGEWTSHEVQGCCWGEEGDETQVRLMYWDPKGNCFQISDEVVKVG